MSNRRMREYPAANVTAFSGNLANGESQAIVAAGVTARHRIRTVHMDSLSTGPVLKLLIGGFVAAQTAAPNYTVDLQNVELPAGVTCSITGTGGAGDGNFTLTLVAL